MRHSAITYLTIAALLARAYPSPILDLYFMLLAAPLTVFIGLEPGYIFVLIFRRMFSEAGASERLGP